MLPPPWVLFGCLPGLCDVSSQWHWVRVWRQNQLLCWLSPQCVLFWKWNVADSHMHSTALVEMLLCGRIACLICYLSERLSVSLFSKKCPQTPEISCILPKNLASKGTFWVSQGRRFSIQTPRGRTVCVSTVLFGPVNPQSWEHNQCFWSLQLLAGRVVSLEWALSKIIRKHHWAPFWLNQMFLWDLAWCRLVHVICAICWIG